MKSIFFFALIPGLVLTIPNVYAGGARSHWSDHYDDYEGAPKCWQDGYADGLDHPFNQDRDKECIFDIEGHPDFREPYYEAFIHGYRHTGNAEETCETFTDE